MYFKQAKWFSLLIIFFFSQSATSSAEPSVEEIAIAALTGQTVEMGPKATLVLGGMVDHLATRCSNRINVPADDAVILTQFVQRAAIRAALGDRYSDPDLGRGIQSQISGTAVYGAGGSAVSELDCGPKVDRVLRNIAEIISQSSATASRFVDTCASRHDERRCACLADIGQSVMPGFRDRAYSSAAVQQIIQRNPFLGLMITMQCGITRY